MSQDKNYRIAVTAIVTVSVVYVVKEHTADMAKVKAIDKIYQDLQIDLKDENTEYVLSLDAEALIITEDINDYIDVTKNPF